ncbi:aldo/keto reductase, partial [bacterium]|nr:aldo/keto reductase [bacterium]
MDYVRLGRAGVKVSRLCLGTAFRGYWHGITDEATAIRTVAAAIDHGINFIDSANYY